MKIALLIVVALIATCLLAAKLAHLLDARYPIRGEPQSFSQAQKFFPVPPLGGNSTEPQLNS